MTGTRRIWMLALAALAAVSLIAVAACGDDDDNGNGNGEASITIVAPMDESTVSSPVTLQLSSTGLNIQPAGDEVEGAAHFHAFVNADYTGDDVPMPTGAEDRGIYHFATDSFELELEPGEYEVMVVAGDNLHVPVEGVNRPTATFTVE